MKSSCRFTLIVPVLLAGALAGCSSAAPASSSTPAGSSSAGSSSASGASSATPEAGASSDAVPAKTATISLGTVIVDAAGKTTYFFDHDTAGSGTSACTGACSATWPAVTTSNKSAAIAGVTGTVGTIPDGAGTYQLTVNGMPLYTYSGDSGPGESTGQGTGGIWWVAGADGKEIKSSSTSGGYTK